MESDRVASLIEQLYDASLGERSWESALETWTRLSGANSAAVTVEFKQGGGWGFSFGALDPSFHDSYFAHYAAINPFLPHVLNAPAGSVLMDRMILSKADYQRSEFFNDWARPQDFQTIMHIRVDQDDEAFVGMGLTRSGSVGDFEQEDLALQQHLAPHFRRSVRTYLRLSEVRATGRAMAEALDHMRRATIGLNRSGQIVVTNQAARDLLARQDVLRAAGDLLVAVRPEWAGVLRRMIDAGLRGMTLGPVKLTGLDERSVLHVEALPIARSVSPHGPAAVPVLLLVVTDLGSDGVKTAQSLRRLYGLTARESDVAIRAARGEELATVAATLGMARSTAQSHLKRVYDKTETHRQAELAWLVARLSG